MNQTSLEPSLVEVGDKFNQMVEKTGQEVNEMLVDGKDDRGNHFVN